ncbi:MAG: carbohydrate porin [Verrucomicrobiae bacterium]|nr:carbohydrate porin [Verrucomicrobiae bacterium]
MLFASCLFILAALSPSNNIVGGTNSIIPLENTSSASIAKLDTIGRAPFLAAFSGQSLAAGSLSPYAALARNPHTILEYEYASGSWLGSRKFLKERGIEASITYTSDSAGNPVGGKYPGGFTYSDNIAFSLLVDAKKLVGWEGGYFMISALQRDGVSLSQQNVKNLFTVQQVYGGSETFRFYEMYWEQRFRDERINFKTGRFVAADDFDSSPLYWLYMSRGIDGRPQSLAVDGRFSAPPNAVWASRLKLKLPESTILRAGAYQVTPNSVNGLNWNFNQSDGVMLLAQYEWDPEFFKPEPASAEEKFSEERQQKDRSARQIPGQAVPKGFIGHYWMGGYYSTYEYPQFNSSTKVPGAYAFYWHGDQTIYRPNRDSNEGLVG